jgi:hypothetical protein
VWLGDSAKSVEALLGETDSREPSKSHVARELILDALDDAPGNRVESDELDARVARETGLAAQTIRNLRADLKNDGLIRSVPVKDDSGQVERWLIERTNAPRPVGGTVTGHPETVAQNHASGFGLPTPDTVHIPNTTKTVTGRSSESEKPPVTESVGTGSGSVSSSAPVTANGRKSSAPCGADDDDHACLTCGSALDSGNAFRCSKCLGSVARST